jgi:acetyl esterase/lipase
MACLEYPLAPEHTFPSQVNSAVAVYKELLRSGYSPSKIALLGDSVGAGLAMSLLVALAREGVELPAAAGLNSPRVELEKYGDTFTTLTGNKFTGAFGVLDACCVSHACRGVTEAWLRPR